MEFSANLSTLFLEHSFLNRFDEAKKYGFTAVEIQNAYDYNVVDLVRKSNETGLQVNLINSIPGADGFGCASNHGRELEFLRYFSDSMIYVRDLGIPKIHIQSGLRDHSISEEEQMKIFISNLQQLGDNLDNFNVIALIEPICSSVIPDYYLDSFDKAIKILKEVQNDQIKLLLDVYHLKKIEGDASPETLKKFYGYAGHIQISQDPDRTEPFHPQGLINYDDVFKFLQECGHSDFIGLEYNASGSTQESLKWLEDFKY